MKHIYVVYKPIHFTVDILGSFELRKDAQKFIADTVKDNEYKSFYSIKKVKFVYKTTPKQKKKSKN